MRGRSILILNLLIMVGYSAAFIVVGNNSGGGWGGQSLIGSQWIVLITHIALLVALGLRNEKGQEMRSNFLFTALIIALIGHGLCFYNGANNASWN